MEHVNNTQTDENKVGLVEIPNAISEDKSPIDEHVKAKTLLYSVDDNPPLLTSFALGIQHFLLMVESTISIPYLITPFLCMAENDPHRAYITGTILFVCGFATILQTTVGIRLPIIQGGTHGFLGPIFAILALYPCPSEETFAQLSEQEQQDLWQVRMREIQGAICVCALFQVILGFTGAIGIILKWITPLVVVPTVTLIGLSLGHVAFDKASSNWCMSLLTLLSLVLFSQYLTNVRCPCPSISKKGLKKKYVLIFAKFPVLLALILTWFVAFILTITDAIDSKNPARTDLRLDMVVAAPWFRCPYPFQWGVPSVTLAGIIGMSAGVLASIIESIGDYYVCARLVGESQPPTHAVNRGIFMEGIGTIISGIFGSGTGTTSYSQNIGAISLTRVGSRRVVLCAGMIMIVCGVIGKVGAIFMNIPEPIIGGLFILIFGMIAAIGLSNLQFIDLNSTRNIFVLGTSLFCGLSIPEFMSREENRNIIQTTYPALDQAIYVLLRTSMLVGGLIGFILDNTLAGTDKERGLNAWQAEYEIDQDDNKILKSSPCYDLPFGMKFIKRKNWLKKFPMSPTFEGWTKLV